MKENSQCLEARAPDECGELLIGAGRGTGFKAAEAPEVIRLPSPLKVIRVRSKLGLAADRAGRGV